MGSCFLHLGRNYRCHLKLTYLLNMTMYKCHIESKQIEKCDHPAFKNRPCIFHCCDVNEDTSSLSEKETMKNESNAVVQQLEEFLWEWPDTESWNKYAYEDVCVISSNRSQVSIMVQF